MESKFSKWLRDWLTDGLGLSPDMASYLRLVVLLLILLLLCLAIWYISKRFIVVAIRRLARRTETDWDDTMVERHVFDDLAFILPLFFVEFYTRYVLKDFETWVPLVETITEVLIVLALMRVTLKVLNAVHDILMGHEELKDKPVQSFVQVAKIVCIVLFGVVILSLLMGRSPIYFLSAMGAISAVLLFVFKDSILALLASVQLMANDLLRVGDWVSVPKYDADGYVIKMNLSTIMVQNWDNTYSSVPPYVFISDSFINYRGMIEGGGRRIMRSLNIKVNSVSFCDAEMIERYRKVRLLKTFFDTEGEEGHKTSTEEGEGEEASLDRPPRTNLEIFRAYAEAYVKEHPGINSEMFCLVRLLETGEGGIPVQIYAFTKDKTLVVHSQVISEIFSHLIAAAPYFGLEVFETPSGTDLRRTVEALEKKNG